ncbi:GM14367 [Drosophila sechellia]|nr:GM14367 [Drosophila sechellia]
MQPLRASASHILLLHFPLHPVACMRDEDEYEDENEDVNVDLAVHVDADGFIKTNCCEFKGLSCNDADRK